MVVVTFFPSNISETDKDTTNLVQHFQWGNNCILINLIVKKKSIRLGVDPLKLASVGLFISETIKTRSYLIGEKKLRNFVKNLKGNYHRTQSTINSKECQSE